MSIEKLDMCLIKKTRLENLPKNLHSLYCSWNKITRLENIPENLHTLYCDGNQISRIENLPQNLHTLSCKKPNYAFGKFTQQFAYIIFLI